MNIFFWLSIYCFKVIFYLFYHLRIYGIQHPHKGRALIAPNHASFLDPPLIASAWPEETHYLARASLFRSSLSHWIMTHLNAHPVNGSAQDLASFKTICQLLNEERKVVIFPEGTRSEDKELKPIKQGIAMLALRAKAPIIPVYIEGTLDIWPPSRKWPKCFGRTACVFGTPIPIESYLQLDKKTAQESLTLHVQQSIENLRTWFEQGACGDPP